MRGMIILSAVLCSAAGLVATPAHAANVIGGRVVDRNNQPLSRAVVSLSPGDVELVTDRDGRFIIDYLRDPSGERVKLDSKTEYKLEVFLPGFHTFTLSIDYKRGEIEVDTVVMVEESLNVQDFADIIDPARYAHPTQSSGDSRTDQ